MARIRSAEKHKQIEHNIQAAVLPMIRDGSYSSLSIREICQRINITTGMFYRHYTSKNDLLAICYLHELETSLSRIDDELAGKSLEDSLLILFMQSTKIHSFLGPNAISIYINEDKNSDYCDIPRKLMIEKGAKLIRNAQILLPDGRTPESIITDLIIIGKGLCFEWYTASNPQTYDYVGESERYFRLVIPALLHT